MTLIERIASSLEMTEKEAEEALRRYLLEEAKDVEDKPRRKRKPGVIRTHEWTRVHKTWICMHCGFRWGGQFNLAKGESTHSFSPKADEPCTYHVADGQEEMHVESHVCNCSNCKTFVKNMSREELEDRYLALLHTTGEAVKWVFHTEVPR